MVSGAPNTIRSQKNKPAEYHQFSFAFVVKLMVSGRQSDGIRRPLMVSGGEVMVSGAISDGIRRLMVSGAEGTFVCGKLMFYSLVANVYMAAGRLS